MCYWSSEEEEEEQEEVVPSSPALPRLPTLPWEVLRNVFVYFLDGEYDYEKGESTLWRIHWRKERNVDGSDILVPYVVVPEVSPINEKRCSDIERRERLRSSDTGTNRNVNPMLSICRETRVMALDPAKGRYASLPVLLTECYTSFGVQGTEEVTGEYAMVHPHRDVFIFSGLRQDRPMLSRYEISLHDGATLAVGEIAQILHDEDPPYGFDMELLRAAAARTGFHFRHILFTENFYFQVEADPEEFLTSWVLVHICENTDPRAHLFDIFLPCDVDGFAEWEMVAGPFVRLSRELEFFPLGPPPSMMDEQPHGCQCCDWPERENIFNDRPQILFLLDVMPQAGIDDELN